MDVTRAVDPWQPVARAERVEALDVLRGASLFGVLLVNLLSDFKVPLAEHILTFHTDPGVANRLVDVLVAGLLEFKAITLFSLGFGAGVAALAERASSRGVAVRRFLARRFLILLALGLCHLILIWNGDILTLYAACGFLLLPMLRLPVAGLVVAGVAALALPFVLPFGLPVPGEEGLRSLAVEAARVNAWGSYGDVLAFHLVETRLLIAPLLISILPRTLGLMLLGLAAWRAGVLQEPGRHRGLLRAVALAGGVVGGSTTAILVSSASSGQSSRIPSVLFDAGSSVPLALAYAAALLLGMQSPRVRSLASPFADAGQMALTNYLVQSVALGFLFHGYGLGLSGRIGSAGASLIGVALYAGQVAFSIAWLRRFRFGPVEWLWRSLTYGRRQPMHRPAGPGVVGRRGR